MSKITLDSLQQNLETKYAHTVVEIGDVEVRLANPLRLPEAKRAKMREVLEAAQKGDEGVDALESITETLEVACSDWPALKGVVELHFPEEDRLPVYLNILESWMESQKAGEA